MSYIPLLTIPLLFLIFALMRPRLPVRVCAICAAVLLTWVGMLGLLWLGRLDDPVPVAILMGMSVVGAMHKLEGVFKRSRLRHLWLARLVVVLGGFATVLLLVQGRFGAALLSGVAAVLFLTIVSLLMQGTTHTEAVRAAGNARAALTKKLDDCC